jgi:predicted dehydrogenase
LFNILVIGLGSIGKRHIRNLLSLQYTRVSVVTGKPLPTEFEALSAYTTIEEAFASERFNTAFICTPTAQHFTSLFMLLQHQVENIYVEKPLSNNMGQVAEVLKMAASYPNNIKVGYDLHFDPGIQQMRSLLQQNTIGKILAANAFVGQYLPHWRPYEDHRKGMSAKQETGGGVLLDIVHEFDYLRWLAGNVEAVACWHTNSGTLEIETEEVAEVLLKFGSGAIGTVHLDYWQPTLVRYCTFTGTKGSITANLAKSHVSWALHDGTTGEYNYSGFERNDRFKEIVRAFLENNTDDRLTTLNESLQSLLVVEAAKLSSATGNTVALCSIKNS